MAILETRCRLWRRGGCQREEAIVKRSLRIVALATVAALVALIGAMALGHTGNGVAATSSAQSGKWCSGKKIVFFPGGPAGGVFAVNVYNGAKQAAADLGPKMIYEWSRLNRQPWSASSRPRWR